MTDIPVFTDMAVTVPLAPLTDSGSSTSVGQLINGK